jgi:hypothetical protein
VARQIKREGGRREDNLGAHRWRAAAAGAQTRSSGEERRERGKSQGQDTPSVWDCSVVTCRRLDLRWGGGGSANSSMTRNPPPLRGRECSRAKREDFAAMRLGSMLSCMTVRRGLGDFKFSEVSGRALRSAPPQPSPNFFRGDSLSSVECGKTAASAGSEQELSSELDAVRQSHDRQWRF